MQIYSLPKLASKAWYQKPLDDDSFQSMLCTASLVGRRATLGRDKSIPAPAHFFPKWQVFLSCLLRSTCSPYSKPLNVQQAS